MGLKKKSQTRSINAYFLGIFIPIVLIVSTIISLLLAWNDYQANRTSRLESQKLIFSTFSATIRQPLIQGSLVEAQIRADVLARYGQIACIEIKASSETIKSCKKETLSQSGLHLMESDLYFSEDMSNWMGHLAITFDNSDLVSGILKNAGKNVVAFVLLACILFAALSIGFSRIRSELNELMKIASSDKSVDSKFKISEFYSIGSKLIDQIEISKASAEAKAALNVARQVAHDIRSPILSLQIAVSAAQSKLDPGVLSGITKSSERIVEIAEDVLGKYLPAHNIGELRRSLQKEPMKLEIGISEMVSEKTILLTDDKGISIEQIIKSRDTAVDMRTSDFKRVLSNIIDNAVHASHVKGIIKIESISKDGMCRIVVSDNGIGMSEEVQNKILSTGGTFGKPKGVGLGFKCAKDIVEKHGGKIEIKSNLGFGTDVIIILPILVETKLGHGKLKLVASEV